MYMKNEVQLMEIYAILEFPTGLVLSKEFLYVCCSLVNLIQKHTPIIAN